LAASFISNQARNVAYWHLAPFRCVAKLVVYWTNNGQRSALALNGSVANDPKVG